MTQPRKPRQTVSSLRTQIEQLQERIGHLNTELQSANSRCENLAENNRQAWERLTAAEKAREHMNGQRNQAQEMLQDKTREAAHLAAETARLTGYIQGMKGEEPFPETVTQTHHGADISPDLIARYGAS